MTAGRHGRGAVPLLLCAVLGVLAGCGGSSDEGGGTASGEATAPAQGGGADGSAPETASGTAVAWPWPGSPDDPGDDLLGPPQRVRLEGVPGRLTWRVPRSYEMVAPVQAVSETEDAGFDLAVQGEAGRSPEELMAERSEEADEVVQDGEVVVGGRTLPAQVVRADAGELSVSYFYYAPDDTVTYVLSFYAGLPEDVPEERVRELHQVLGSLDGP
ncbi:hypothetical protein [Nocardioides solisilvae]|uniref:hypothetical protein n=1 Tax=Nocardioides solisilvae TaxID=1542435 RepID=UPI000D7428DF|nr:hypothetical protein [Nocardioides solisilvae]